MGAPRDTNGKSQRGSCGGLATTCDQAVLRCCTCGDKNVAAGLGGGPAAREPGLGTGRGGDVTGSANSFLCQRAETVAGAVRGSPSATHTFGSDCDCRFTKR